MNSEQKADRGLRLPRGIWLLFFGSLLLRYAFADYPHAVVIYPDELLYRTFAETIAAGRGLVLYNQPFDFQKILYSVVLAPAFLVRGRQLQFHLVALINAAVMSSAIFPFCWIAQRLLGDRRLTLLIGGFGCLLPDLCYTATYMSEVLFLPLSGWLLCGFCLLHDAPSAGAKRPLLAALLGAGSYLVNINKEVALLFPAAWILYAVGDLLLSAPQERREKLGESLLCIAAMLLGLGGLRLLFNAVFFRGMGSYYDLLSLDGLFSPGGPKYLIYAFFYCLMNVTLSAGLFPLAIPALFYREMKPRQRRFFLFLLLLVLVFSAIIAFTLSLQEDYQITPIPRAHMRYFCFLWLPCLMLLFAPVPAQGAPRREQLMLLVLFALGGLMFLRWYGGAYDDSTVDNTVLKWAGRLPFDHVWLRLLCVLLAAAGLVLFYKRRRLFLPLFLLLFCTAQISSNVLTYRIYNVDWRLDAPVLPPFERMQELIESEPESNFLVVGTYNRRDKLQGCFDAFFIAPNSYVTSYEPIAAYIVDELSASKLKLLLNAEPYALETLQNSEGIDLRETALYPFLYPLYSKKAYDLDHVEYLIVRNDLALEADSSRCVELSEYSNNMFTVYRLNDPTHLPRLSALSA